MLGPAEISSLLAGALSLERGEFLRLRMSFPTISNVVIPYLCRRLREASEKLETMAHNPLDVRLARSLSAALQGRPETAGRRTPLEASGAIGGTANRLFCDRSRLAAIAQAE